MVGFNGYSNPGYLGVGQLGGGWGKQKFSTGCSKFSIHLGEKENIFWERLRKTGWLLTFFNSEFLRYVGFNGFGNLGFTGFRKGIFQAKRNLTWVHF